MSEVCWPLFAGTDIRAPIALDRPVPRTRIKGGTRVYPGPADPGIPGPGIWGHGIPGSRVSLGPGSARVPRAHPGPGCTRVPLANCASGGFLGPAPLGTQGGPQKNFLTVACPGKPWFSADSARITRLLTPPNQNIGSHSSLGRLINIFWFLGCVL